MIMFQASSCLCSIVTDGDLYASYLWHTRRQQQEEEHVSCWSLQAGLAIEACLHAVSKLVAMTQGKQ